jgi:O-acetyl-ADP-ribose deacetylase (regulator of RNase III)
MPTKTGLRVLTADITSLEDVEVIVNAANGKGPMGRGVAGAIGFAGGPELRNEVRRTCEASGGYKEGDCYISGSGEMADQGIKKVYHAVTMEYPGGRTSVEIISRAMRTTLDLAVENGVKSIAFPALGTGVGGLPKQAVASAMVHIAQTYCDRIAVTLVDIDGEFISYVSQRIQVEKVE